MKSPENYPMGRCLSGQVQFERLTKKMKKSAPLILLISLFVLAPLLTAFDTAPIGWGKNYKLSTLNNSEVKNLKGEGLGKIEDFVMDPLRGRIAFVILSHAGTVGMGQKVKVIPYEFLSFDETGRNFILDASKEDLTSPIEVKNLQGEKIGEIEDFVIDSQGRIPFVALSHGGKIIVIPYSAFSIQQTGNFFVLDASEEKLASAPVVDEKEDSIDQAKAKEIYRYFGQTPYWTEEF
jgi:sporulation protein YlmC with PRC-barrel domain